MKRSKQVRIVLALITGFALIATVVGLAIYARPGKAAVPSSSSSPPGSTQTRADLTQMQALLNTGSVFKEAGVLVPGSRFAPGSGPIFHAGTTITIKQETFRSEPGSEGQQYGAVEARLSSGQIDTLGLVADQGHWYLYDVAPGTAQASARVTYGPAEPVTAQLDSSPVNFVPSGLQIGTHVPVIFIHGWTGDSGAFGNAGQPDSMIAQVEAIHAGGGTWAWSWNYGPTSTQWVTSPSNGPAFASYIYQMHEASLAGHGSGKVIIVAYSMGGLITRYAAGQTIKGNRISDDISMVITIGTPNTGSFWANALGTVRAVACKVGLEKLPSKALNDFCTQWTALSGMARFGSQINALPELPLSIELHAIVGSEILDLPLGFAWVLMPLGGDGIVSLDSALYARPGDHQTFTTVTAWQADDFSALHTQLPSNSQIIADVHGMVLKWIQDHPMSATAIVYRYIQLLNSQDFTDAWNMGGNVLSNGAGYDTWVAGYSGTAKTTVQATDAGGGKVSASLTVLNDGGTTDYYQGYYDVDTASGTITGASITQVSAGGSAQPGQGGAAYWLANGGQWYVHGLQLQISQGGPTGLMGTETWNEFGAAVTGTVHLEFTVQPDGSLRGIYTDDPVYTKTGDASGWPGPSITSTKNTIIRLVPDGPMHAKVVGSPFGGNDNLCQQGLTPDVSQSCGA